MHPFQLLAEPIRLRIIEILASGEHPSGMIAETISFEYGVTRATTSWHLRILLDHGWVDVRPDWANRHYILHEDAIEDIERSLHQLYEIFERRYGAATRHDSVDSPVQVRPYGRAVFAERLAMRGKGRKDDVWHPNY